MVKKLNVEKAIENLNFFVAEWFFHKTLELTFEIHSA